jgi:DNA gyrase subunit A
MDLFAFSDEQAEYILMLRLQTLVGLEIQKILNEIGEKKELIEYLMGILSDQKKLDGVVIDEMIYIKDTYGDLRKTEVVNDTSIYDLNQNIKALKRMDEMIKEPVITWI